jgi:hypothetical protein
MFGFAVVLAALAFTGAPSTPIRCNPALPVQGRTYWDNGSPTASLVELDQQVCAGVILLAASPRERQQIVALNGPVLNVAADEGIGAETVLIEEIHTTHPYNGSDETDDACRAMSLLPTFLGKYLGGDDLAAALRWANLYYASQPAAIYHTHPC